MENTTNKGVEIAVFDLRVGGWTFSQQGTPV